MCARHRPENGADSEWNPRPFRVLVCDRFDEDDRRWIMVPAAIGPGDASTRVRMDYPEVSVLMAQEVGE